MLFLILLVDKYNFWYHDKFMNWFKFTVEDTYINEILISISIISSRDPVWRREESHSSSPRNNKRSQYSNALDIVLEFYSLHVSQINQYN